VLNSNLIEHAELTIVLYDAFGELVLELKKGVQEARIYSYTVDAGIFGLNQGVYIPKMKTGNTSFSHRLIRMRENLQKGNKFLAASLIPSRLFHYLSIP
jgi:hypothetical protein